MKDKDSVDCSQCNSFTPEQRAKISTLSYKIKKEKREAKHADISQPTDELIDPSSVSVIGVVGGPSTDKSPVPPEKKAKKDKPSVKPKKSATATLSSATEDKLTALEDKWSDRFNRLESLLLAKSMEPAFSSDVRVAPSHSAPPNVTRDSEPFFQPPKILQMMPFSALAQTLVLPCSRRPVSLSETLHYLDLHHLSTLAQTMLLHSKSRLVSLKFRALLKGALVQTPLLRSISRPVSLVLVVTDLPQLLLRFPNNRPPTILPPTDPLAPPALLHRPFRRAERTAFLT